ncbi:MAG: hypothetical protein OXH15_18745 [Gammaproteobacteria bacterium]|nr:hypothetical protein [Gammaproteobacteria bacterium]
MASLSIERERQAREEVGVTSYSRGVKWFLSAFFVVTVAGGTVWHLALDLVDTPRPWPRILDPTRLLPATEEVRAVAAEAGWAAALKAANDRMGTNIADYETDLEDGSPVIDALMPTVNAVVTDLLGGSTESVYRGRDGWWFFRPDIDYVTGPGFLTPRPRVEGAWDPLPALDEFHRALNERKIALIVAPIPVKPSIYPERFSTRFEGAQTAIQNPSYAQFLARLDDAGIAHVDLGAVLWEARRTEGSVFLTTDTHWSPVGVALGAAALGEAIERMGVSWERLQVSHARTPTEVAGRGDTIAMLDLTRRAPETVTLQRISRDGQPWAPQPNAEVLLLGDSFTNIYALPSLGWGSGAGLAAQLSAALGRPVDALAINDNGSYATRAAVAAGIRRGRDRLSGKKVVVYAFASRELAFGDWRTGYTYDEP